MLMYHAVQHVILCDQYVQWTAISQQCLRSALFSSSNEGGRGPRLCRAWKVGPRVDNSREQIMQSLDNNALFDGLADKDAVSLAEEGLHWRLILDVEKAVFAAIGTRAQLRGEWASIRDLDQNVRLRLCLIAFKITTRACGDAVGPQKIPKVRVESAV